MTVVKYYYIGEQPKTNLPLDGQLSNDGKLFNPLFNFNSSFVTKLQSLTATTIAQSQPFISLKSMKLDGTVLEDLNIAFFHKPIEMEGIRTGNRFAERPSMSLQEIEISTDLASGYLYYTNVKIKIRIHKPDFLVNTSLMYFLFPSAPLLLEYGWNSPDEDFMGQKERLLFSLKTYDITFDEMGQIDLSIEGTAFNESFSNIFVGDLGKEIVNKATAKSQFKGIFTTHKQIQAFESYFEDMKQKGKDSNTNDYKLKKSLVEDYQSVEKIVRGIISKNFRERKKKLVGLVKTFDFSRPPIKCLRFHDIVKTMCDDTFKAFTDTFPKVNELRVIYGEFNEKTPKTHMKSIAEFPINYEKFKEKMKTYNDTGKLTPTISDFLNTLISDFMENQDYWRSILPAGEDFNVPEVAINFSNNGSTVDLAIIDTKSGIPPTIPRTPDAKASSDSFKQAILAGQDIPVINIGHANSFIKNIKMSQITDQYMKAVLIERMARDRIIGPRATKVQSIALGEVPITPLTLPLKGSATLLGHPGWKPFKVFFLEAGIFVIDGLYKITKVSHRLAPGVYDTNIEFMWH